MIEEVMRYCRNFFPVRYHEGEWIVEGGRVANLPKEFSCRYYLIEGSMFNDGVYSSEDYTLDDEQFRGYVTELAPPKSFLALVDEIVAWQNEYNKLENLGPYMSESFGGYTYQKATNASGKAFTWKDAFASRLNEWRLL